MHVLMPMLGAVVMPVAVRVGRVGLPEPVRIFQVGIQRVGKTCIGDRQSANLNQEMSVPKSGRVGLPEHVRVFQGGIQRVGRRTVCPETLV